MGDDCTPMCDKPEMASLTNTADETLSHLREAHTLAERIDGDP